MAPTNEGISSPVNAELSSSQRRTGTQGNPAQRPGHREFSRKPVKCRYFGTKRGCRAGEACAYVHESAGGSSSQTGNISSGDIQLRQRPEVSTQQSAVGSNAPGASVFRWNVPSDDGYASRNEPSMVHQKPVSRSELENPRDFSIRQIHRRFNPQESHDHNGTHLKFSMRPTDPDFQFDLEALECDLHIPLQYPNHGSPSLEVLNKGLDAESRQLVQQRFDHIVKTRPSGSLLQWMNALDRQLEHALTHPAPEGDANPLSAQAQAGNESHQEAKQQINTEGKRTGEPQRREREISQLSSRLGRDSLFKADAEGLRYTVPIKPMRPELLPSSLRQLKTVVVIVPPAYPYEPCRIEVAEMKDEEGRSIERAFMAHATANTDMSLMAHINYLAATMHKMASQAPDVDKIAAKVSSTSLESSRALDQSSSAAPQMPSERIRAGSETRPGEISLQDRPHIQVIPRPPEWDFPDDDVGTDSDISNESWSDDDMSEHEESGGVTIPKQAAWQFGRRVNLSFPNMELHGVELLSATSLSVAVKCERCKEHNDVKNIRIGDDGISVPATRTEICQKCSTYLQVGFYRNLMHAASNRAGTLYMDGCTAVDLLPGCNFVPTCAECSTGYPSGVGAIGGDHKTAICRECHNRMSFKLPELKFLLVSAGEGSSQTPVRARRKPKESLGIVAGQELPRRGRCSHYGRSYRWFRFSCCSKVFPCDKCHDAASDHPNEHANRMICGVCSREQNYRPEDCGLCRSLLVGKAGTGFWEGGKGTRNKALMSRKDPRKYKRRGGAAVGSSSQRK